MEGRIVEKLKSTEQKEIIQKCIGELSKEDPNLYYTDSSTIATLVHDMIHNSDTLNREKKDLVSDLSADDILILMSYKTNCC